MAEVRGVPELDIVGSAAEAARLSRPALLIIDRVNAFMDTHGLGSGP